MVTAFSARWDPDAHATGSATIYGHPLRRQHHLNAAVLLIAEGLVGARGVIALKSMSDDKGRVDLASLDLL